jgi:hypothetical protein
MYPLYPCTSCIADLDHASMPRPIKLQDFVISVIGTYCTWNTTNVRIELAHYHSYHDGPESNLWRNVTVTQLECLLTRDIFHADTYADKSSRYFHSTCVSDETVHLRRVECIITGCYMHTNFKKKSYFRLSLNAIFTMCYLLIWDW